MKTYRNKFNIKHGFNKNESHSLKEISKLSKLKLSSLQDIYNKGIGAYKTNPQSVRPNVKSKEQWAMARVYSAIMGGKAARVDKNELSEARKKLGGSIKSKNKGGDCYYAAGKIALDNDFIKKHEFIGTPYLIHAEVTGQGGIKGLKYGHAWIEDDVLVYDYSNNRELKIPKVLYYAIGNIKTTNPKKYQKYTFKEAKEKMLSSGNYGCWDLDVKYSEGGTAKAFTYEIGGL